MMFELIYWCVLIRNAFICLSFPDRVFLIYTMVTYLLHSYYLLSEVELPITCVTALS